MIITTTTADEHVNFILGLTKASRKELVKAMEVCQVGIKEIIVCLKKRAAVQKRALSTNHFSGETIKPND